MRSPRRATMMGHYPKRCIQYCTQLNRNKPISCSVRSRSAHARPAYTNPYPHIPLHKNSKIIAPIARSLAISVWLPLPSYNRKLRSTMATFMGKSIAIDYLSWLCSHCIYNYFIDGYKFSVLPMSKELVYIDEWMRVAKNLNGLP